MLIDKVLKVATPATALTVVVPLSAPPVGFVPIAITIDAELVFTRLPPASSTCTVTAGVIVAAATVLVGCCVKANCAAEPTFMLNAALVAVVSPVAVAVKV